MIEPIKRLFAHVTAMPRDVPPARGRMHLVMQVASPVGAVVHLKWAALFWHFDQSEFPATFGRCHPAPARHLPAYAARPGRRPRC